jgi:hypothetical protein
VLAQCTITDNYMLIVGNRGNSDKNNNASSTADISVEMGNLKEKKTSLAVDNPLNKKN